jgi:Tfp pilus assembly protein PilX
MSVASEVRAASNRRDRHEALIAAERSPRAALRRAVEWVMSEARHMDTADVQTLTGEIADVARLLNGRSRS